MFRLLRNILSEKTDDFTFYRYHPSDRLDVRENSGLYIHIPFCTHFCPYCPYVKIRYQPALAREYQQALRKEIRLYRDRFGSRTFTSLYFGGGSPTLMKDELEGILDCLFDNFRVTGDIAIETTPNDISRPVARKLKSLGFNMVSLGIQTFNDHLLKKIGRDYDSACAIEALSTLMETGFETVNTDLIFSIDGQSLTEIQRDLSIAVAQQVTQITCYPLFTFPHSEIGELKKINGIRLPGIFQRRKMYYFIHDFLSQHAFHRTNVWSFNRTHSPHFSSVTRDFFLGFGTGSGSYNGEQFYFNTFSVPEYMKAVDHSLPVSIRMNVSQSMKKLFWLYWQLYKTTISVTRFRELFGGELEKQFHSLLGLLRMLGFIEHESPGWITLNTRGAHWIHLLQNYFALNYVHKIWSASRKNSWPEQTRL